MILEDLASRVESVDREQLDELLAELCELLIGAQKKNPEFFGMVAAGVLDPSNRFVVGINFESKDGTRVHAERAAIERYKRKFGPIPKGSMIITTLSPCNQPMEDRYGESCADLLESEGLNYVYCGYKDPSQERDLSAETTNLQIKTLCKAFADTFLKPEDTLLEYQGVKTTKAHRDGLDLEVRTDEKNMSMYAYDRGGREVAHVHFDRDGKNIVAYDLEVNEDYRGQGIAAVMYDYAKELGYRVERSYDQTDAGKYFWDKNRGRKRIWEDKSKAQTFIDSVYSQYPDWPYGQADKVMVWGEGEDQQFAAFKLKLGTAPDTVEIDWIMAGPEQRKGVGSRAIKELQRQAQEAGIKLTLYPWAKGNISQASLTKLYKRHGFKPIAKGAKPMRWEPQLDELKIDNVKGLGAVPYNQEVDYMGLRVKMKPSMFLKLALPLNKNQDDEKRIEYLEQHRDLEGFGAPFLQVDMDRDFPRITGHDGRHRMEAILQSEGDNPVEVHIFPRGMRNRDMTPELINKLNDVVVSQSGRYTVGPIFSQPLEEGWRDVVATAATVGALAAGGADAVKNQFYNDKASVAEPTVQTTKHEIQKPPKPVPENELSQVLRKTAKSAGIKGTELAQFMAQCAHETANFTRMKEMGGKKHFAKYDPKSNPKKAKKLGNTKVGDGEKYHGRGFIQLTGRENYRRAGEALGLPLEQRPELVEKPEVAAKVAVWYWQSRVQPRVDNFADTSKVTKPINPALKGLEDRKEKFKYYQVAST